MLSPRAVTLCIGRRQVQVNGDIGWLVDMASLAACGRRLSPADRVSVSAGARLVVWRTAPDSHFWRRLETRPHAVMGRSLCTDESLRMLPPQLRLHPTHVCTREAA